MRNRPSVCHVSTHACIRAHKIGWTWALAGYETHLSSSYIAPTHSSSLYDTVHNWMDHNEHGIDGTQLAATTRLLSTVVDLFHVHNEPNWIFKVVKENTDKPVIWDIHDWTSLGSHRLPFEIEMEGWALTHADGFCVPSQGYYRRIRALTDKPTALVYSKVPKELYPPDRTHTHPGLVYEGGTKGKSDLEYNYPYRNWSAFAQEVVKHSQEQMYFYTSNDGEDFAHYENPNIHMERPVLYNELLFRLGTHTAGLVGSPYPLRDFEDSMPNKLFEYVSAGIPVIIVNAPEAQRFAEFHGLGIGVQDPTEVKDALTRLKGYRIDRERWKFAMQGELPTLENLYGEVLRSGRRVIRQPEL